MVIPNDTTQYFCRPVASGDNAPKVKVLLPHI